MNNIIPAKTILVDEKKIGPGYPAYFIAEIGSNFDQSLERAKDLIFLAKESGADTVKFQYWDPSILKNGPWDTDGRREIYHKAFLDLPKIEHLISITEANELEFLISVFGTQGAMLMHKIGQKEIKIPWTIIYLITIRVLYTSNEIVFLFIFFGPFLFPLSKLNSIGTIRIHILRIQVYKATANFEAASEMYNKYTNVNERFQELRNEVIARRKPRKMFVQPNLLYSEEKKTIVLEEYAPTAMGIIQSFMARYRLEEMDEILKQADAEANHHQYY